MKVNKLIVALLISAGLVPSVAVADSGQFDWSGFYAGAFAGSGKSDSEWKASGATYGDYLADGNVYGEGLGNFTSKLNNTSSFFGAYAGYNLQSNHLIYGIEADYGRLNGNKNTQLDGNEGYVEVKSKTKALGSIRARVGYAVDKFLVFGTAGVAFNDSDHNWTDRNEFYGVSARNSESSSTGWVAGAGVEYAVTDKVILRGEGLYYDFGSSSSNDPAGARFKVDQDVKVLRAGLAYKF